MLAPGGAEAGDRLSVGAEGGPKPGGPTPPEAIWETTQNPAPARPSTITSTTSPPTSRPDPALRTTGTTSVVTIGRGAGLSRRSSTSKSLATSKCHRVSLT